MRPTNSPKNPNARIYWCTALFVFMAARIILPADAYFSDNLPMTYLAATVAAAIAVLATMLQNSLRAKRAERAGRAALPASKKGS